MPTLAGRTFVVTGASSGIGAATALRLAREGADLVLGARREARLAEVQGACEALGRRVTALPLDVCDAGSTARFVELALAAASVSGLVNNAGLARGLAPVAEGDPRDWREMMEANVLGLMHVTRALLPALVAAPLADLVHVGSVAGLQPYARGAAYCASKAAVEAFASALRLELFGTQVRQLVIEPGMVQTEFSQVRFHGDEARAAAVYAGVTPLSADDVADVIAFAVTRPAHVALHNVLVMPTAQAAATLVARRT